MTHIWIFPIRLPIRLVGLLLVSRLKAIHKFQHSLSAKHEIGVESHFYWAEKAR